MATGVADSSAHSGGPVAPPATLASAFRRIGPGIVLASAIVGSGEVIATTTLGAQTGYAALWIVLVSCAIKPVVQAELGRYTIVTGKTGLEGFDAVPGARAGGGRLGGGGGRRASKDSTPCPGRGPASAGWCGRGSRPSRSRCCRSAACTAASARC